MEAQPSCSYLCPKSEKIPKTNKKLMETSIIESKYEPRPVMMSTSKEQLDYYLENVDFNEKKFPEVFSDMCHALRFWLAVLFFRKHYDKNRNVKMLTYSTHFDINYKSIFNFATGLGEPNEYNYLSPGEYNFRSKMQIIKTYGRPEDKRKYLSEKKI